MKKRILILVVSVLVLLMLFWFGKPSTNSSAEIVIEKMNGVSFVAPPRTFQENPFDPVRNINANWVAVMPYAFSLRDDPLIHFDSERQWWGERTEGIIETIEYAHAKGLKVLLKPHIWVRGDGWTGAYELQTESEWVQWEQQYLDYILPLAIIADSMEVEAFCIGLEFKRVIEERPQCWKKFIREVRNVYGGQLTYAANWDNFGNVTFWDELDFIGINAYFPLSETSNPSKEELLKAWKKPLKEIEDLQKRFNKPIVFTEFGYRSIDKSAGSQWELEDDWRYEGIANTDLQCKAYEAIFEVFWIEPWFAGGFVWKWYDNHQESGGIGNTDYTPQNKPAEEILRQWYLK